MIMANEFSPTIGTPISKEEAEKWIDKFDKERKKDTKSVFYGRDAIEAILSDTRASGISFFFSRKTDEKLKKDSDDIIMVGTTEDGTLLWNADEAAKTLNTSLGTYDHASQCPPYCAK
jgi:hypothetical protein